MNLLVCQSKLLKPAPTISRWAGLTLSGLVATLVMTLSTLPAQAVKLKKGDIVVADAGAKAIIQVDPTTGKQTTISSGGNFQDPDALTIDARGNILVADDVKSAVFRVNPKTGNQTIVSSGGSFATPIGITTDASGNIFVADAGNNGAGIPSKVIRVDPKTGTQTIISSNFSYPLNDIITDASGNILVCDSAGEIIRVDPTTGTQTIVSSFVFGGSFNGITTDVSGDIFVSYNGFTLLIFRADPTTGGLFFVSGNVSDNGNFKSLAGLDTDAQGNILVADYRGATIFQVGPTTGKQTITSSGGSFVTPVDLRVYKGTKDSREGAEQYDSQADYH